MAKRARPGLGMICGLLFPLALALPVLVPGAFAQTRTATPPVTQLPAAAVPPTMQPPPAAMPPAMPLPAAAAAPGTASSQTADLAPPLLPGTGLCQCIADTQKLDFSCPGSPQACQSACGAQYSFKPDALCRRADNP